METDVDDVLIWSFWNASLHVVAAFQDASFFLLLQRRSMAIKLVSFLRKDVTWIVLRGKVLCVDGHGLAAKQPLHGNVYMRRCRIVHSLIILLNLPECF
jgi:hypothetical protein